jgi:hypothetical protein
MELSKGSGRSTKDKMEEKDHNGDGGGEGGGGGEVAKD